MSRTDGDHFIYRLFDADGVLLYVGCSARPHLRLPDHRRQQPWGGRIDRMHVDPRSYDYRDARFVESLAIAVEAPVYNVVGKPQTTRLDILDEIRHMYDVNECAAVSA